MKSIYKRLFARSLASGDRFQKTMYGDRKRSLFENIHGQILEIGAGTGVNLVYIPETAQWTGLEPNPYMHRFIYNKAKGLNRYVDVSHGYAEDLPFDEAEFDAVICTLVLCSVTSPDRALAEIYRVLKPGGTLYFLEHVIAPEGTVLRQFQRILCPVWQLLADGCRPDRNTSQWLNTAGFSHVEMESFTTSFPIDLVRPHIIGRAVK